MAEVIKLDPRASLAGEPVPEVVAQLEELLAAARSGDLRGFAYVTATDKGGPRMSVAYGWNDEHAGDAVGIGVAMLHVGYFTEQIAGTDETDTTKGR